MKRYKMTLTILSPVHIGSGEEIDPTEYIVKDGIFYRLDLPRFLSQLNGAQRAEFDRAVSDPNPWRIRDFIRRHAEKNPEKFACFKAEAAAFQSDYNQSLSNQNRQLQVNLFTRTPGTWKAYIPGSSIKGAIRTAVINTLAQEKKAVVKKRMDQAIKDAENEKQRKQAYERFGKYQLEPLCLNQDKFDPLTDPFRCVKVEDVYLPDSSSTFVGKLKLFHRIKRTYTDVQMFCEQTYSLLHGKTVTAEGVLTIDDILPKTRIKDSSSPAVSMEVTREMIIKSCQDFYWNKMEDEDDNCYFDEEKRNPHLFSNSDKLLQCPYDKKNEFPLRLGRFSHVECTTVDEFCQPYNARGRGKSRTLSGGIMPMGWVKVRLDPLP